MMTKHSAIAYFRQVWDLPEVVLLRSALLYLLAYWLGKKMLGNSISDFAPYYLLFSVLTKVMGVMRAFEAVATKRLGRYAYALHLVLIVLLLSLLFSLDYWIIAQETTSMMLGKFGEVELSDVLYFSLLTQCLQGSDLFEMHGIWARGTHVVQVLSSLMVLVFALIEVHGDENSDGTKDTDDARAL